MILLGSVFRMPTGFKMRGFLPSLLKSWFGSQSPLPSAPVMLPELRSGQSWRPEASQKVMDGGLYQLIIHPDDRFLCVAT
jgi:hypothetical protein